MIEQKSSATKYSGFICKICTVAKQSLAAPWATQEEGLAAACAHLPGC